MKLLFIVIVVIISEASTLYACNYTVKSFKLVDSKSPGAKISYLKTVNNITSGQCLQKCCDLHPKDHCNIANFMAKNSINNSKIIQAEDLGNCTLISCVPLSSCQFITSKVPCYSIILQPSKPNVSDLLNILKNISDQRASIGVNYTTKISYSNGADASHTKPRKGVSISPNVTDIVTDESSGSKPRKGVTMETGSTTLATSTDESVTESFETSSEDSSESLDSVEKITPVNTSTTESSSSAEDDSQETESADGGLVSTETSTEESTQTTTPNEKTTATSSKTTQATLGPQLPDKPFYGTSPKQPATTESIFGVINSDSGVKSVKMESKSSSMNHVSRNLIVGMVLGTLLLITVVVLVARTFYDSWQRRHYRRMDFLVDGMYDN